jgi:hypothetical protein
MLFSSCFVCLVLEDVCLWCSGSQCPGFAFARLCGQDALTESPLLSGRRSLLFACCLPGESISLTHHAQTKSQHVCPSLCHSYEDHTLRPFWRLVHPAVVWLSAKTIPSHACHALLVCRPSRPLLSLLMHCCPFFSKPTCAFLGSNAC